MNIRVKLPSPVVPRPSDAVIVVDELVTEGYCDLPLWMIRPSRTNRTYFNVDALQQLADNIAEVGILQPILVRPVAPSDEYPQHYEIVAGERRFRASVLARLAVVPVRVRAMTDLQAAELQLIENLQREDPHPLEEAEGMQMLMLNHGYNADQLAAAVKQSRSYVYARLKLCALATNVRDQFMGEQFNASIGLLIARLPTPEMQIKATKEILKGNWNGEPLSYREAKDHLRRSYMLDLKTAVFSLKDAKLLESAGACTTCPKRAGNQPEIYPDEKDANICTAPTCFDEKTTAFLQQKRDQAAKKGMPIIAGDAAKKIMPNDYGSLRGGYSDVDKKMYLSCGATSYREILGKELPALSLLDNPHRPGNFIRIARTDELEDLVEAKAGKGKTEASQAAAAKAREKKQEREAGIERQYRKDLFMAVRTAPAGNAVVYDEREVAVLLFRNCPEYAEAHLRKVHGWDGPEHKSGWDESGRKYVNGAEKVYTEIRALDPEQARQLVRDLVLVRDIGVNTYTAGNETPALLLAAAGELNVDAGAEGDALAKAAQTKDKEKADKAKKKAAKPKAPAQAEIVLLPPADNADQSAEPAEGSPAHELPRDARTPLTLDAIANVELGGFISANPDRIEELTELVMDEAPHLLAALERAANRVGYVYNGGWSKSTGVADVEGADAAATATDLIETQAGDQVTVIAEPVRKTLKLKNKDAAPPATAAPAGPTIKVKKPPRTVALPKDDWPAATAPNDTDDNSEQDPV